MPTLQVGATQTAVMLTPPGVFVWTPAVPAVDPLVLGVSVAFGGDEDTQLSAGIGFVNTFPSRSTTVGVMVMPAEILLETANEVFVSAFPT